MMRQISKKTAAHVAEAREQLKREVGRCEICEHDPDRVKRRQVKWALHEHHIARGAHRSKALGKRFAVLVLCFRCHMVRVHGNEDWPESRQLAVLKKSRRKDHNLAAYNKLVGWGKNRITEADVDKWKGLTWE